MIEFKLKKVFFEYWPIIIITSISLLLPAIWFRSGMGVGYVENGLYFLLKPFTLSETYAYAWTDFYGLGATNSSLQSSFFLLVTGIFSMIGLPLVTIQYLLFCAVLLSSSLAVYKTAQEIFKDFTNLKSIALFSSLFYILNPYTMNIWHRYISSIFILPLMPLLFLIIIKLLKNPSFQYSFYFALTVFLLSINAVNPAFFLPAFIPAIIYAVFNITLVKNKRLKKIKYIAIGVMLTLLMNLWWLINSILNFKQIYYALGISTFSSNIGALREMSKHYPITHIIRLLDTFTIPWYGSIYSPGWIEILIPVLVFIGIYFYIRNKKVIFFIILIFIGIFLSKGLQPPGGTIYEWLFLKIPGFSMFRKPFEKFGLILPFSYSFLISIGFLKLLTFLKTKILKIIIMVPIIILLLGYSVWPMWTGDVFSFSETTVPRESTFIPSTRVEIPDYWYEASEFVNIDKEDYRIAFLPQAQFDETTYKWEFGYHGNDVVSVNTLFNNPVISNPRITSSSENYRDLVLDKYFFENQQIIPQLFSFMNLRYILIRNDISPITLGNAEPMVPFDKIKNILDASDAVEQLKTIGKVDVYKLNDDYFLPHIYIPEKIIIANNTLENLIQLINFDIYPPRSAFYFSSDENKIDSITVLEYSKIPKITVTKINKTKYRVKVRDAIDPYILVFSESFHANWKIYFDHSSSDIQDDLIDNSKESVDYFNGAIRVNLTNNSFLEPRIFETLGKNSILDDHHMVINGFANSWLIRPSDVGNQESYELIIEFWPQRYMYIGIIISLLTLIASMLFLVMSKIKTFRIKH